MLTKKQLELLKFIHKQMQRDAVSPSFDEMKSALGLQSKSGIHRMIVALEERGFIRRLPHRARAIEVIKLPESMGGQSLTAFQPRVIDGDKEAANPGPVVTAIATEVPLVGRIAAGVPIEAIINADNHVAVPQKILRNAGQHFALEVKGDSMIEAGINDGDVVIICETGLAESGDIVVAQIGGYEATLKKFLPKDDAVALEAANPAYETRVFPRDQVEVQGVMVGLIRTY